MSWNEIIQWSTQAVPLSDFVSQQLHSLPVFIKTKTGVFGGDDLHDFSADEILLISAVEKQGRYVIRDEKQKLYSIPAKYPMKFRLVNKHTRNKSTSMTIQQAAEEAEKNSKTWGSPAILRFKHWHREMFVALQDSGSKPRFGALTLENSYDEVYLLASSEHCKTFGADDEKLIVVPTYLDMDVFVAVGLQHNPDLHQFNLWVKEQETIVKALTRKPGTLCDDIVQLSPKTTRETETVYEHASQIASEYEYTGLEISLSVRSTSRHDFIPPVRRSHTTARETQSCWGGHSEKRSGSGKAQDPPPRSLRMSMQSKAVVNETTPANVQSHGIGFAATVATSCNDGTSQEQPPPSLATSPRRDSQTANKAPEDRKLTQEIDNSTTNDDYLIPSYMFSLCDVPKDLSALSVYQVGECLRQLNMAEFVHAFQRQDIDGQLLKCLDEDILTEDFLMSRLQSVKLRKFVQGWRPNRRESLVMT